MKKGTKKLITRTLQDRIDQYERSIEHCKAAKFRDEKHIEKLLRKVEELNKAISEIDML